MTRDQLEHIIRAAAVIAEDDEIMIVGSQAILGKYPDAPESLRVSVEADVYPKNHPERADLIDGSIGELSPFHDTYGYYAQGVGPGTATLPSGWESRLIPIRSPNTRGSTGFCIEPHDLVLSKYVPFREKDEHFIREAISHGLIARALLEERLPSMPIRVEQHDTIAGRIARQFASKGSR